MKNEHISEQRLVTTCLLVSFVIFLFCILGLIFSDANNIFPNSFDGISLAFLSSDQKDGFRTEEVEYYKRLQRQISVGREETLWGWDPPCEGMSFLVLEASRQFLHSSEKEEDGLYFSGNLNCVTCKASSTAWLKRNKMNIYILVKCQVLK